MSLKSKIKFRTPTHSAQMTSIKIGRLSYVTYTLAKEFGIGEGINTGVFIFMNE